MDEGMLADQISIDEIHGLNAPEEEPEPPSLQGKEDRVSALRQHFSTPEVTPDPPERNTPVATSNSNDDPMAKYRLDPENLPPPQWDEATGTWSRARLQAGFGDRDDLARQVVHRYTTDLGLQAGF